MKEVRVGIDGSLPHNKGSPVCRGVVVMYTDPSGATVLMCKRCGVRILVSFDQDMNTRGATQADVT